MAVVVHVTLRGLSQEQYDAVRTEVGWLENTPQGGLAHLAWWEGDDNHNVDGWVDEAAFQAFANDRLGPAMAKLGIEIAPEVTFHPAHEVFAPEALRLT
jgi:hypothetical protein